MVDYVLSVSKTNRSVTVPEARDPTLSVMQQLASRPRAPTHTYPIQTKSDILTHGITSIFPLRNRVGVGMNDDALTVKSGGDIILFLVQLNVQCYEPSDIWDGRIVTKAALRDMTGVYNTINEVNTKTIIK